MRKLMEQSITERRGPIVQRLPVVAFVLLVAPIHVSVRVVAVDSRPRSSPLRKREPCRAYLDIISAPLRHGNCSWVVLACRLANWPIILSECVLSRGEHLVRPGEKEWGWLTVVHVRVAATIILDSGAVTVVRELLQVSVTAYVPGIPVVSIIHIFFDRFKALYGNE